MGHGYMWAASAEQHGYPTGGTIQLGDVMSFERGVLGASGEYGHVVIVEEIHEDGSILISESGGGQRRAWTRLLTREQARTLASPTSTDPQPSPRKERKACHASTHGSIPTSSPTSWPTPSTGTYSTKFLGTGRMA